jgi:sulfotransferase
MKQYYFMAGMPRSGSTLLSSILNQNPRFYSGPSTPVLSTMITTDTHLHQDELYTAFPKPEQLKKIVGSIIDGYYSDIDKPVIIDKNRGWSGSVNYIEEYITPNAKIICTIRDISEILTSFIMLIRKNGQITEGKLNVIDDQLIKKNMLLTDDNRCEFLLGPDGICGVSSAAIFKGLEKWKDRLHFVEYNNLIKNPTDVLKGVYEFLGEDYYEHTFEGLTNINKELDSQIYGLPDLHTVRSKIEKTSVDPKTVLSEKILAKCKESGTVDVNLK